MTEQDDPTIEVSLVGGRSTVTKRGDVVFRQAAPWSRTVAALLVHLEKEGFEHAPRIIGDGFDENGREVLTYIDGESPHPYPWGDDALPIIGSILRTLHAASASFVPPADAVWRPWFGRQLGQPTTIGHCDTGAWNIIARKGVPVALIDWEEAGPVDPLIELAQACWLNALLFDDDLGETLGLGPVDARGRHVKMLLDGYELPRSQRAGFVGIMRDFAILSAANEAIDANVTPESTDPTPLWAVTWRTRSAGWLVKHDATLERIITAPS